MNITSANYNNQPKFKALKIDAKTVTPLLEQAKPEYIKRLDNVGKDLVGIKRFNVVLKDTLTPKVFAQDPVKYGHKDYFKELKYDIEPKLGKPYHVTNGDETLSGFNPNIPDVFREIYPKDEQMIKYKQFSKLDELDQAAEYSKLLDKKFEIIEKKQLAVKLAEQERKLQEMAAKQEHKKAVSELVNNYELIEMKPWEPEKTKKKWWQIF